MKYMCDIPWYMVSREYLYQWDSMYFGATNKWRIQMVMVSRVVQLAGAMDAPSGTRVPQSPSLCSNLGYARRINIVLWMFMYNQPKSS